MASQCVACCGERGLAVLVEFGQSGNLAAAFLGQLFGCFGSLRFFGQSLSRLCECCDDSRELGVELHDAGFGLVGVIGPMQSIDVGEQFFGVYGSVGVDISRDQGGPIGGLCGGDCDEAGQSSQGQWKNHDSSNVELLGHGLSLLVSRGPGDALRHCFVYGTECRVISEEFGFRIPVLFPVYPDCPAWRQTECG